jgi:protease secretion system membrane fusion protein
MNPTSDPILRPETLEEGTARSGRLDALQRWGTRIMLIGLLAFVAWAAVAPLDEGVPTQAVVSIDTKRKTVQHLQGGIVREVLVREGDQVKEGQILIRLNDGTVRANMEATRQRYLGFRAMESRLLAEQAGAQMITWHPDVQAEASDPLIKRHIHAQEQLMTTRRAGLEADLQGIEESIRAQEVQRKSLEGVLESRRAQQRLVSEQLGNIASLVKDGYAPRNQQLDLERQLADVTASLTELQGNLGRSALAVAELRQRATSRRQDYRKESDSQLADVTREVQSDEGRLQALREELARTEIRSPATGQVVGLSFQTVGGVIAPGQRLMDVVPQGETLLLEARIPPHLIDSVKPGLQADVRFSTFVHTPQLVAQGRVVSVSGDLLTEQTPMGQMSFFLTRVELTPSGMDALGRRQIQPGMPAEVIIKTGERTVLTYLLHPLTRRVAASMKEQ